MAGNVTGLHVFTADVGPEPLSLLDNNFNPLVTALNTLANFSNYYVDSGAVNVLVVTTVGSQVFTYVDGMLLEVKVANTTTSGAPTLNVNALGAKTITDNFGNFLQLGAMIAGARYFLIYDGTNFRLLNPSAFAQRGIAVCKFKPAPTTRNTITTNANDPDLIYAIPAAGSFEFEVIANYFGSTTGVMGVSANINYSGTFTAASSFISFILLTNTGIATTASQVVAAVATNIPAMNSGAAISTSSTAPTVMVVRGVVTATGAGTLGFAWAQSASNANNLNMMASSSLKVTQLS